MRNTTRSRVKSECPNSRMNTDGKGAMSVDENKPFPPRFFWLKRLTFLGVVLLIALVGLRIWWGWKSIGG